MAEPYPGAYSLPPNVAEAGEPTLDKAQTRLSDIVSKFLMLSPGGKELMAGDKEAFAKVNEEAGFLGAGSLDIGEWFVRGTVVILGFIFVAVGLAMFQGNKILAR